MEFFPAPLENLVEQFARLPGIGSKSAQRLAFHVLNLPQDQARAFADAILEAKRSVTLCPVCQNLTSGGLCPICASPKRDESTICVVADPRDVVAIERSREYNGRYHVLHGVLSPMNHVGPDDLQIKSLVDRVAQGGIQEVIMATNPDTDGETTAMYLARLLKPFGVKVTRLAYGIPVGGRYEACMLRRAGGASAVPFRLRRPIGAGTAEPVRHGHLYDPGRLRRQGFGGPGRLRPGAKPPGRGPVPDPGGKRNLYPERPGQRRCVPGDGGPDRRRPDPEQGHRRGL